MKIAIPIVNGRLSAHFGHCEKFAFVDVDDNQTIVETRYLPAPAHEPGLLPRWLAERGAALIIAGGMGARALGLFRNNGVEVIVGAPSDKPEALVEAYLNGTLVSGANICDH